VVPAAWAVSAARVGREVPAAWALSAARVGREVPAAWAASAVRVGRAVPEASAGQPNVRQPAEASDPLARNAQAARLAIWVAGARRVNSGNGAHRVDLLVSSGQPGAEGAAAASPEVVDAAAEGVAAGDVVAGDAGDNRRPLMGMPKTWPCSILAAILWFTVVQAAPGDAPQPQRSFASAEEAATAFVAVLRDQQEADLLAILGPEGDRVIDSGDRYADQELHKRFIALYDEKHAIDLKDPGRAELDVGPNDWPMPIPLVENNGRWTFDTKAGAQTIVDRRIGRNELSAIRTLLACADAQQDYFERARQANGSGEYAARLVSTPERRDGLYWPVEEGEAASPLGPLIDAAQDAGYPGELVSGKPIPYEGYYFRILKAQGPSGDGGARNYVRSGRMTGGFALIAWPAVPDSTGIMTFIVGPDGDVYQKDLGPTTARIAAAMTTFNPDLTWSRVAMTNE
jgi:Protein of unknown function (DUF2950)